MSKFQVVIAFSLAGVLASPLTAGAWEAAQSPVNPGATGYVPIAHAVVMPERTHVYRTIFDATRAADDPAQIVPALDMAGSELNLFGATGVPLKNVRFAVVFHGAAISGILNDAHYRAKFGVANPNLKVIADMRKAGVELFVCGQNLAAIDLAPTALTPDVKVASDALIVLMAYENNGYALLSF